MQAPHIDASIWIDEVPWPLVFWQTRYDALHWANFDTGSVTQTILVIMWVHGFTPFGLLIHGLVALYIKAGKVAVTFVPLLQDLNAYRYRSNPLVFETDALELMTLT